MTHELAVGLLLVLFAGLLQGSFVLPMTLTRGWAWEHNWAVFSLLGMLVLNWLIAWLVLPDLVATYRATPEGDLGALAIFGGLWGAGAVLFGLGMARLGMALGYPIIMGLILSLGAIIPLLLNEPAGLATPTGAILLVGALVTIAGIVLCSRAAGTRDRSTGGRSGALGAGLVIAVFAGALSCLPNVGMNYAEHLKTAALEHGASPEMAGNAAWALLFTAGFVVNILYCAVLMGRNRSLASLLAQWPRNLGLIAMMALLWIGSFYLYGMGAARLGRWGGIVGWPLFICVAILVGNLWGLVRGEWRDAPTTARRQLALGIIVLLLAVAVFGVGSAIKS